MVYGTEEVGAPVSALAATLERAAEVPATGLELVPLEGIEDGMSVGRVVNRKPVLSPMTELKGL
jgi:hypothetical protein